MSVDAGGGLPVCRPSSPSDPGRWRPAEDGVDSTGDVRVWSDRFVSRSAVCPGVCAVPQEVVSPAPAESMKVPPAAESGDWSLRSDEGLVAAICRGEEDALAELWRRYGGLLTSQALRVLQSAADADDAVAEVFEEVWARSASYHVERARPVAWLLTLVRRRSIDRLRIRKRHRRIEAWLAAERTRRPLESGAAVDGELQRAEMRDVLVRAMERLPEKQRVTVWMAYYRGCSHREIAQQTGCPVGTVKTRLESALRKMREGLCPRGPRGSP